MRRHYIPASRVVRRLARKHDYNPAWIWDVLDDYYFNMRRDEGCVMTQEEAKELELMLQHIDNDRPALAYM